MIEKVRKRQKWSLTGHGDRMGQRKMGKSQQQKKENKMGGEKKLRSETRES